MAPELQSYGAKKISATIFFKAIELQSYRTGKNLGFRATELQSYGAKKNFGDKIF